METLVVLGARIPTAASLSIPFVRSKLAADGAITDPETASSLTSALESLAQLANTNP